MNYAPIAVILISLSLGFALRRSGKLPGGSADAFNGAVLWICLPAMVLRQIHGLPSLGGGGILFPALAPWAVFALAAGGLSLLGRLRGWSTETRGAAVLTAGLGNTSFVGYPLIEAIYGKAGMPYAVLADQLGSFLILSTLGLALAERWGKSSDPRPLWRRCVTFPPFIALLVALAGRAWPMPVGVDACLERLSAPLVPLAVLSIGCRLAELAPERGQGSRSGEACVAGLLVKLALAPALVLGVARFLQGDSLPAQVVVAQCAMGPMITAAAVADGAELDRGVASRMVAWGVPLSLLTVPLWSWVARWVLGT